LTAADIDSAAAADTDSAAAHTDWGADDTDSVRLLL
jgi:hypothetical protein